MQTHLSYATYQKLCEKFGAKEIHNLKHGHLLYNLDLPFAGWPCLDMNVILSKEFIDLISPNVDRIRSKYLTVQRIARYYNLGGMPAVEEYILSLL